MIPRSSLTKISVSSPIGSFSGIFHMNPALLSSRFCVIALAMLAAPAYGADDAETAVRARVESYQTAYNRHDAKAVAEHWSEDAEYLLESGGKVRGRDAIQKVFEKLFNDDSELQIDVTISSIRFVTPDVAVEEGKVEVTGEDGPAVESTYTAVNVKKNGVWYVDSIRETDLPAPPSNYQHLKELSWMIGQWESKEGEAVVKAKCDWAKNKNFITRSFSISIKDKLEVSGTQVIGWDAPTGKIKSWMFDSDGGVAEGIWTRKGNEWSVKTTVSMPDGSKGSAVHVVGYVDDHSFTWHTVSREIDGEILPNIAPVTIVRVTGQ